MSHFDDVEPLIFIELLDSPRSIFGLILSGLLILALCLWASCQDNAAKDICTSYGERYIDSRSEYTLCEQDNGVVMRREAAP